MTYEVELKFALDDRATVESSLRELGAQQQGVEIQRDHYFNHPDRDFALTNEAFRVRNIDQENRITYKGPIVDTETKTRKEIEIPFAPGARTSAQLEELLKELGFRPVHTVTKKRTIFALDWENRHLEITLDEVDEVGNYLEIETLAGEDDRESARDVILKLARHLGFHHAERRSYLRLLLEKLDADGQLGE